ncbi:DUF2577 domain-containing protein [Sporosarcina sp. resist]|uniref:DUF2577 domain-containing protein n=1 Tax=Sporosarcina sp. resist TaxID=2762563 RepID=UPI00164E38B3|nr:DUF2577 domain-containing protein [Sporosarcina sp. resist]QNK89446.1 DUF2577 domain-containing protein [Sporosarcina sp. resist]
MSLVDMMKEAALDVIGTTNPVTWTYGTVVKSKPLEIYVHAKLTLLEEFLDVAESLTRHDRIVSIDYEYPKEWEKNDIGDEPKNAVSSRRDIGSAETVPYEEFKMKYAKLTFEDGLKINDKVILVRMQGGRKFLVADRYKEGKDIWSYPSEK